ncbi:MAG: DNA methyltransferase [Gammaproteobacteria bacterium]|nr:DNA methyltransferase [Gammaproteobacteria bacterium]
MSRLSNLLRHVEALDPQLGDDLRREVDALSERRAFGLNFERHIPETVELPNRPVRRGDKVRFLPERGKRPATLDRHVWRVDQIVRTSQGRKAILTRRDKPSGDRQAATRDVEDLVVVAEFRDPIYPGLASTGKIERGGDRPFHAVINAENFHALQVLLYTHEGKVDAIYIDPPYNTGARDWKYNNDYVDSDDAYRHSKWLAMIERRLKLAKRLLNPANSVLIVTIDEKECLRLGLLLDELFPASPTTRVQMVSTNVNPAAIARGGAFGRSDEYVFFVMIGAAAPHRLTLSRDWVSSRGRTHTGKIRWDLLRRSGTNAQRSDRPGLFYPIYVDPKTQCIARVGAPLPGGTHQPERVAGLTAVLPIRRDLTEGNWQWGPETLQERMQQGRVRVGGNPDRGFTVYVLKDGEYAKVRRGEFRETGRAPDGSLLVEQSDPGHVVAVPGSQWRIPAHDSTQYGTRLLSQFLPRRKFPFPKSLYAVEDALRFFVKDNRDATVLDFFAGSGTTAHAVMRLNREDDGRRTCIIVTNNEVSANEQASLRRQGLRPGDEDWESHGICEYFTKPRLAAAVTGKTPDGSRIRGSYKFTHEFPMADGLKENVEFFNMTYEAPRLLAHNRAFDAIAPLLWLKAGSRGSRIEVAAHDFDVADTYAVLFDLDASSAFLTAVAKARDVRMAFVVTDDDRGFQSVCGELPTRVEAVRLYESYLTNFTINAGRE